MVTKKTKPAYLDRNNDKFTKHQIEFLERKIGFKRAFDTTVIGAFTFVAGLFWRDVANSLIETFLPEWSGFFGLLFTATLVTAVFVVIASMANKHTRDLERELSKLKDKEN